MALIKELIFLAVLSILYAQQASIPISSWKTAKVVVTFKPSCYESTSQNSSNESYDTSVEGIFPVGCTIQAKCSYYPDDCKQIKNESFLEITLKKLDVSQHTNVTARTVCDVEVLIPNVTFDFNGGEVFCQDKGNSEANRRRTLTIGYPPVKPENLTVIYLPSKFISLTFDKMKTGPELNDDQTKWSVSYEFRYRCNCSDGAVCTCQPDQKESRTVTCKINLGNEIPDMGYYPGQCLGNTHNEIDFIIKATNQFGENLATKKMYLPDNIYPGKVSQPKLITAGTTWLQFKTHLPKHIKSECPNMKDQLRLQYSVSKVPETDEHKLTPETEAFYQEYGFYRNLQDDEAAATRMNLTNYTYTDTVPWLDCETWMHTNVTGLAPYSRYAVRIRLLARYEGLYNESGGDQFMTAAHVPQEGPAFSFSPYTCFMGQNSCVACVIYFQEIPRPLRQSKVIHYYLNGSFSLYEPPTLDSNCKGKQEFEANASGNASSVLVEGLMPGSMYNLSIEARTILGPSPSSTYLLETIDFGDSITVELEMKSEWNLYKLYWDYSRLEQDKNTSYFVHYCYSDKAVGSYNCETNRVIETAASSQTSDLLQIPKFYGSTPEKKSLRVLFFMSFKQNGKFSGLYPEKWRYRMDRAPGPVSLRYVKKSDSDPSTLEVIFERIRNDEDNPQYGRPTKFAIRWQKIMSQQDCDSSCLIPWKDGFGVLEVDAYRKGPFLLKGLEHSTMYCVGVRAEKEGQSSAWTCDYATTGEVSDYSSSNVVIFGVLFGILVPVVLTCLAVLYCYCRKSFNTKEIRIGSAKWPKPPTEDRQTLLSSRQPTTRPPPCLNSLLHDSGIEEGAVEGPYEPGNEIEASGSEATMGATGRADIFVNPQYEPSMSTISESSAPLSEGSEEEGPGRYGRITAVCSETGSSGHEEQEEKDERGDVKWCSIKEEGATDDEQATCATDDEQETCATDDEQITCDTDDEQTHFKQPDLENGTSFLVASADASTLRRLPGFLFEFELPYPNPQREKSYEPDKTRGVEEEKQLVCGSVDASFPNMDKALTLSQQTVSKESGFDSEDCKSDSDSPRYSLVLKDSSSTDVLHNADFLKQQGTSSNIDASCSAMHQGRNNKVGDCVPPHIQLILMGNNLCRIENGCENLSSVDCVDQSPGLHYFKKTPAGGKSSAEMPMLSPDNKELDSPSMVDKKLDSPSMVNRKLDFPSVINKELVMMNTRTSCDPQVCIPSCVLELLKKPQNEDPDNTSQCLPSVVQEALSAEKQSVPCVAEEVQTGKKPAINKHADGISSKEEMEIPLHDLEKGGNHFPMTVQNGTCSRSAEQDETLTMLNPESQDFFSKSEEHAGPELCSSSTDKSLFVSSPDANTVPRDQAHHDIISSLNLMTTTGQPSSGEMIRPEGRVAGGLEMNGVLGNGTTWMDQCKSEPTRRKRISYCRVTSARESS